MLINTNEDYNKALYNYKGTQNFLESLTRRIKKEIYKLNINNDFDLLVLDGEDTVEVYYMEADEKTLICEIDLFTQRVYGIMFKKSIIDKTITSMKKNKETLVGDLKANEAYLKVLNAFKWVTRRSKREKIETYISNSKKTIGLCNDYINFFENREHYMVDIVCAIYESLKENEEFQFLSLSKEFYTITE